MRGPVSPHRINRNADGQPRSPAAHAGQIHAQPDDPPAASYPQSDQRVNNHTLSSILTTYRGPVMMRIASAT
jgi:hypothetical protein